MAEQSPGFHEAAYDMLLRVRRIGTTPSAAEQAQAITQLTESAEFAALIDQVSRMQPVLRDWVMVLPRRVQGTLLTAIRSCDLSPKPFDPERTTSDRAITAYLRWLIMVPADPREVDRPGAFMRSQPPENWKPSEWGHYPQHWVSHLMHTAQVCAYCHPAAVHQNNCWSIYDRIVRGLHLRTESRQEMMRRLTEDRIASGDVVS